jgi:hypothetical protein
MILGLFSQKIIKVRLTLIVSYIELFVFIFIFFVPHQNIFCENSPRIIAASGADPAVLKTGSQALVYQFLPNLYTNFTKLSNTPLIR